MSESSEPTPIIDSLALGPWETNCYVLRVPGQAACWIVDAGYEPGPLIESIRSAGLTPQRILLTHAHLDHIGGLREVRRAFPDAPIAIHEAEAAFLTDPSLNLSAFLGQMLIAPEADERLEHGQTLELAGTRWRVLHTPGHSPGGVAFVHEASRQAIVGDTLFAGSIGRFDFPTSDGELLLRSIREQLMPLPDDTRVYPGHGPFTTIGRERLSNPYVTGRVSIY